MLSARDPAAGNHPIRCTYHFARPPPVHQLNLDQKIPHQIQNLDPGRNNGFMSQSPRHTVQQSPLRATCLAGVVQWNPQRRMTLIPGFEAAHLLQHRLRRAQLHLRNGLMAKILPGNLTTNQLSHHHPPSTRDFDPHDIADNELISYKSDSRSHPSWKTIGLRLKTDSSFL